MSLLKLFTLPKALLKDTEKFTNAGGKVTFSDALEMSSRSVDDLTDKQQSDLMKKFGDDSLVKDTIQRARDPGKSQMSRDRINKQVKKQLMSMELLEEGRKAGLTPETFDPDLISAKQFFRPNAPGILQQLKANTKRIKDETRELKILEETRARQTEAAKPVVDISAFRKVDQLTPDQKKALDSSMKGLFPDE